MRIVIFSGAGMSAESGISTFRDSGGLWEQYRIEDVATPEAWAKNPEKVQRFYNLRRKQIIETQPNKAHHLIAKLEQKHEVFIITQNIDDLHERSGSTYVMHLHGNIRYSKSSGPNSESNYFLIPGWELTMEDKCPEGHTLRPHVVWFGEAVPMLDNAIDLIRTAEIFIVIGTSLNVYPAAGLIHYATSAMRKIVIDPNVSELNIPNGFECFSDGAIEGMEKLFSEL
jgi:NAD-dependent deacetylase